MRESTSSVSARSKPEEILATACPDWLLKVTVVPSPRLTCVLAGILTKALPPFAVLRVSPGRTVPGPGTATPPTDAPDDEMICPIACWPPSAGSVLQESPRTRLRQMAFLGKWVNTRFPLELRPPLPRLVAKPAMRFWLKLKSISKSVPEGPKIAIYEFQKSPGSWHAGSQGR